MSVTPWHDSIPERDGIICPGLGAYEMPTADTQIALPFSQDDHAGLAAFSQRNPNLRAVDHDDFPDVCEVVLPWRRGGWSLDRGTVAFSAYRDPDGVRLDDLRTGASREPFGDLGEALGALAGLEL